MNTSASPQSCALRTPNPAEQRRQQRLEGISFLFLGLVPLILLIPIISTPRDPEVPKMITGLIGMEAGIYLFYRRNLYLHKKSRIYFDARCLNCYAAMTWALGSSKYGLDKKGAFRCRCNAPYSYETVNAESVLIRPRQPQNQLIRALAGLVPRAWTSD